MKKVTIFATALLGVALISCKKDRVCECTETDSLTGATSTYKVTYYDSRKKDARLLCQSEASQYQELTPVAYTGDKTTCELK
ncbi:MAG: hypothetical protein ACK5D5_08170 [Bacteroidota bacterium]|jgi:hypothetical protein